MKKEIILVLLFLLIASVNAEPFVSIMIKPAFLQNETIEFNYTISGIKGEIEFARGIECDDMPVALIHVKSENLSLGEVYSENFKGPIVDIEYKNCFAYVNILSPVRQTFTKNFSVIGLKQIQFSLIFNKKIVVRNQKISIDYLSSTESPEINAILIYPSGKTKQIVFPIELKLDEIGAYTLEAIASKEGHKTATTKEQFAVIEKETNIKEESPAPITEQFAVIEKEVDITRGTPAPITEPLEKKGSNLFWFFILLGIIALIVAVLFIIHRLVRRHKAVA